MQLPFLFCLRKTVAASIRSPRQRCVIRPNKQLGSVKETHGSCNAAIPKKPPSKKLSGGGTVEPLHRGPRPSWSDHYTMLAFPSKLSKGFDSKKTTIVLDRFCLKVVQRSYHWRSIFEIRAVFASRSECCRLYTVDDKPKLAPARS